METNADKVLEHHGIKGMKWGVRRDPVQLRSGTYHAPDGSKGTLTVDAKTARITSISVPARKEPSHEATQAKLSLARAKSQSTDVLSNKELQDLVTRMNLEQQYNRLALQPHTQSMGKKFIKEIAQQQLKNVANDMAKKQIAKLLAKAAVGA